MAGNKSLSGSPSGIAALLVVELQRRPFHHHDTSCGKKNDQKDLVVTSAQPGVLYVSGLPVEKNVFTGLRRKIRTLQRAFALTHGHNDLVDVRNASCLQLEIPDESIDYVFTDPPFGGNIPYSEVNFINEAWLGQVTDAREAATLV